MTARERVLALVGEIEDAEGPMPHGAALVLALCEIADKTEEAGQRIADAIDRMGTKMRVEKSEHSPMTLPEGDDFPEATRPDDEVRK